MTKLSAIEKAIQSIGKRGVELLESEGIKISWKHEYDLKEFILAAKQEEDILMRISQMETELFRGGSFIDTNKNKAKNDEANKTDRKTPKKL
jgi:hypothetical protein